MKKLLTLAIVSAILMVQAQAQTRYLDPIYPNVGVSSDVTYGVNATVLYFSVFAQAVPEALKMDVYTPVGDTETERPLILYFHTGNFAPFANPATGAPGFNGSCGGTKTDSAAIVMCTQLAQRGYVVASCTYRLGWEPTNPDELRRRFSLINAAYRGVQDARTAVRYFKRSFAENSNPWGIDTSRITVWGQGTGGYVAYAAATLDEYLKIPLSSDGKFLWEVPPGSGTILPMVLEPINGDIYATSFGVTPGSITPNPNDTLCYPNHVGYSSDFQLMVNLGGALGDTSWLDAGQIPMLSFQVPTDPFAPYTEGILTVPGVNYQVVEVQGAYVVQKLNEDLGNNASYINSPVSLALEAEQAAAFANSPAGLTEVRKGLYPLITGGGADSAPWEWSAPVPGNPTCNLDRNRALRYIDTIMQFVAPRACFALGLQPCIDQIVSSKEPIASHINVVAAPNPSVDQIRFESPETILSIQIFNNIGSMVRDIPNVHNNTYFLQRESLRHGNYVVKLNFKEGFVTKIVQFQ